MSGRKHSWTDAGTGAKRHCRDSTAKYRLTPIRLSTNGSGVISVVPWRRIVTYSPAGTWSWQLAERVGFAPRCLVETKNVTDSSFLTIRQIRTKAVVETCIEQADSDVSDAEDDDESDLGRHGRGRTDCP